MLANLLPNVGRDLRLKVGVLEGATHTTRSKNARSIKVAEYAIYNEFGTTRIPARPFMSTSLDTFGESAWLPELAQLLKEGVAPEQALARVGAQAQGDVRRVIEAWEEPENKDSTIRQKRSRRNDPLVDSGDMVDAIDFAVEGAGA